MFPGDFQLHRPSKRRLFLFGLFGFGAFLGSIATAAILAFQISAWLGLPLNIFGVLGFNEGPEQPIAFPHTVHVQEAGVDCIFCHRNVTEGAAASVPAVGLCMTCHKTIGDGIEGVEKLRGYHENDRPIDWIRVHRVPDHVHFLHEAHVNFFSGMKTVVDKVSDEGHIRLIEAKVISPGARVGDRLTILPSQTCVVCHGDVGSMDVVKQVRALKMGDCVDCHRGNSFVDEKTGKAFAPTDCTTCHY